MTLMELITSESFLLGTLLVTNLMLTYLCISYLLFVRDMERRYAELKRSSDERDLEIESFKKDFGIS
jgi:hypothetical protein